MAKVKTKWICQNCGYETPKSLGKCPDCGTWASFVEEISEESASKNSSTFVFDGLEACTLNNVQSVDAIRFSTGLAEFDRVLGGGLVEGSLILLSGDPGIGKSTLLLQAGANISNSNKKVLYATAEESASQIKLRAERLEVNSENLYIFSHTNLEAIKNQIEKTDAKVLIIDSIQAIYTSNITSSQGSVSQIRECTNILMEIAKKQNSGDYATAEALQTISTELGTLKGDVYTKAQVDAKIAEAATGGEIDLSGYATTSALDALTALVNGKQDKLTAGTGITITDNTISASVDTSSLMANPTNPGMGSYLLYASCTNKKCNYSLKTVDEVVGSGSGGSDYDDF